jgi:diguanylate cyclase (GGDEF)-like protein/PAS domain S-box-containing protein
VLLTERDDYQSTILVVDDNLQNVLVIKTILQECGDVHFSESASDALTLIPNLMPDIILLDIEMPEMSGWEMINILKQDPLLSGIPVIFITSHTGPHVEVFSLKLGGVDFITKPFDAEICRLRVGNLLRIQRQNRLIECGQKEIKHLVKQVPVLITYWDKNWKLLFSNDENNSWFAMQDVVKDERSIENVLPKELAETIRSKNQNEDDLNFSVQVSIDSVIYHYQVYQSYFTNPTKQQSCLITLVDITESKNAKQALVTEKEHLRVTLNSIGDSVIATDRDGRVTFMNPIAERMTGWRYSKAEGKSIDEVMNLRDKDTKNMVTNPIHFAIKENRSVAMGTNCELVSEDGSVHAVEDSAAPINDVSGNVIGAIIVFHDISQMMAMALKMSHLANHDQLTDLPNRILLQDRIIVACKKANSLKQKVYVTLLDIDNFKYINDSFGHQVGDDLICQVAERLKLVIPDSSTLARLGGDEFVILSSDYHMASPPSQLANKVLEAMKEPYLLDGQSHSVSVSMGISVYPDDAKDAEQIMHHADVAMYRAKQEGRNRYSYYSFDLEDAVRRRFKQEVDLRSAIVDERVLVYFQPKFELDSKKIVGAEALVRLKATNDEILFPDSFIELAEETGLIVDLGLQVLRQACLYARQILELGFEVPVSVNVAAAQFESESLEDHIALALAENNIPPHLLELEITETAIMTDATQTQAKLTKLKKLGINISIDDFGTGYSSLSYLRKFDVDVLKIDMSFVQEILLNKQDLEIVKTIILLGNSLNLKLVAEGVETQGQCDALLDIGCKVGQGYLFSKPIAFDEFLELIQNQKIH